MIWLPKNKVAIFDIRYFYALVCVAIMQLSAAFPGGIPPETPGDLQKQPWQKDSKARGLGEIFVTNAPPSGGIILEIMVLKRKAIVWKIESSLKQVS